MASQSEAPSTDEPPSAVAEKTGNGSIACLYAYVGKEANLDEVARDLRNQAPTILFVCCCDGQVAEEMKTVLSEQGVDNRPRGDGGKGQGSGTKGKGKGGQARAGPEDFQVQFQCISRGDLIVAGRNGIVKELDFKEELLTPLGSGVLIAEVGFNVGIQQMLSLRVAAIGVPIDPESAVMVTWDDVAQALERRSVRVLAGEFTDKFLQFLKAMRNLVATRVCAVEPCVKFEDNTHWLASSAMVMMGPVGHVTMMVEEQGGTCWTPLSETRGRGVQIREPIEELWKAMKYTLEIEVFRGNDGEDKSRGWPMISKATRKKATIVLPHTKKMLVFMGGTESRRTNQGFAHRDDTRSSRAEKRGDAAWARPYRRSEKGHWRRR